MDDERKVSRRGLFGLIGGGSAALATRVMPAVETVAPKIPQMWETMWRGGSRYFWDGARWVRAYSDKFLVK